MNPRRMRTALAQWFRRFFSPQLEQEVFGAAMPTFGRLGLAGALLVILGLSGLSLAFLDPMVFGLFTGIEEQATIDLLKWAWIGEAAIPLYVSGGVATVLVLISLFTLAERRRVQLAHLAATFGYVFFAVAAPGGVTAALKQLIGRARPFLFRETGYWEFQPFGGSWYASMPSGDTCNAFALATALGLLFPKTRFVMFPYAVIVAVGRMAGDRHYFTDVMLGAILGMAGAYWVALWCARRRHVFDVVDGRLRPRGYRVLRRPITV